MENEERVRIRLGIVTAEPIPPSCARCSRAVARSTFRIALESERVNAALDSALLGKDVVLPELSWICSACAILAHPCPDCGSIQAGIPLPWFIDDDGLVTCNPFCPDPSTPISCTNTGCIRFSKPAMQSFMRCRRHAIECQGFPDPYAGLLWVRDAEP